MTATLRVRVLCFPFPRYTEKPCDNGQESSRVDEELRLLHNHRRARCLDIQCNAHCRLCTVVQSVIAQASLENMWLQITDQRGEFSGELVSIADIVYFSAAYKPVQCTQTANGFVLVPKSSHSTFASSRICGYSSVVRHFTLDFTHSSICRVVSGLVSIQGR